MKRRGFFGAVTAAIVACFAGKAAKGEQVPPKLLVKRGKPVTYAGLPLWDSLVYHCPKHGQTGTFGWLVDAKPTVFCAACVLELAQQHAAQACQERDMQTLVAPCILRSK